MHYKFRGKKFVIDDESYFTLKRTTNKHFFSSDISITSEDVKYKKKLENLNLKFYFGLLSQKIVCQSHIFKTVEWQLTKKFIKNNVWKRLFKFIKEKHSDKKYIFWPDKASSHYANATIRLLKDNKVNFIPKHLNPTNVPQCRPIEDFFGYLKDIVYKNGWQAQDTKQLKRKIISSLKKVDPKII